MTQTKSAIEFIADTTKERLKSESIAKRTAVRLAIAEAIENGYFSPGDRLPTERELVDICNVSLGTVQAALSQLVNVDLIERKRGSGTIVKIRDTQPEFGEHVWHFRFCSAISQRPLRIMASRMEIGITHSRSDLKQHLGNSDVYTHIRRRFQMSEDISIFSEMFLHPATAPEIVSKNKSELWVVNIRLYLEEEFGIKTRGATHAVSIVRSETVPFEIKETDNAISWFKIVAHTFSSDGRPVYTQEIYAPADQCVPTFQTQSV